MLNYTRIHRSLELDDLPVVRHALRAATLEESFSREARPMRLWKAVVVLFRHALGLQTALAVVTSVLAFFPQFAMFNILRLLESKRSGAPVAPEAYSWAVGLALVMFVNVVLENWLFYTTFFEIAIRFRSLLASLVFKKTTVRKDIKDPKSHSIEETGAGSDGTLPDDDQASRQAVINLIGVDSQRCSDFAATVYNYPSAITRITVSISLLASILGWLPLIAGLLAFALSLPFNISLSKKFGKAHVQLMKARDARLAVVNEALMGIRQVKLSGLVREWEQKILKERNRELGILLRVYLYDFGLVGCWIFSPISFSAASLAAYSMVNGSLSASVAFTTISIFNQVEVALSLLPELTNDAIEAFVSLSRIERYLQAPEVEDYFERSSEVEFQNASIGWPSAQPSDTAFSLTDLNLKFPAGKLSLVSGRTGSGKTLLLNAIIGEAEKLRGRICRPQAPHQRFDKLANKSTWILEGQIAYVSQTPWIENASVKQNILYGLPYDQGRYRSTLRDCALESDLKIMPDGEDTEIGAGGINISGGQRWRISLARALYSRAGLLILDGKTSETNFALTSC